MAEPFATVEEMMTLWREMSGAEAQRAEALLPVVSDNLRQEAKNRGYDLDQMVTEGKLLANVVKDVAVAATARMLRSDTNGEPVSQYSQSALGYSVSGTYLNSSGSVYFTTAELKRLGILRQRIGVIEPYGDFTRRNSTADSEG